MYFGEIKKTDIANGPGVRVSLFVSGCTHHCPGCFNENTWDFSFGMPYTQETEDEIIAALAPGYVSGFTVLGGEPLEPDNQRILLPLFRRIRESYPDKPIWIYSGYLFDREITSTLPAGGVLDAMESADALLPGEGDNVLQQDGSIRFMYRNTKGEMIRMPTALRSVHCEVTDEILTMPEVIVDGKFIASEKDLTLRFRGSRNQRLVDVASSLQSGKAVLWDV